MEDSVNAGRGGMPVVSLAQQYAANRRRFTLKELAEFEGKWVAFSRDGARILASAATQLELAQRAEALGLKRTQFRMEPITDPDVSLLL